MKEGFESQSTFASIDEARTFYKEKVAGVMDKRNEYRDMISTRKGKEQALLDILAQEKIDIG